MTDPADRHLAEEYVEGRLHALARGVSVPVVSASDDVRRGRRRLLQVRLAMAGGTAAALTVVLGVTGLTAGDPTATEVPPATTPPSSLPAEPTTSASEESTSEVETQTQGEAQVGAQAPPESETAGTTDATGSTTRLPGSPGSTGDAADETPGVELDHDASVGPGPGHATDGDPTGAATPTSTPTSEPTSEPTTDPSASPTDEPTAPPTTPPTIPPTTDPTKVRLHQVLRAYNTVLAEHLDPARDHLQPYSRKADSKEVSRRGERVFALGSTYRWEGGSAAGGLQATVASGWDQLEWECGASWSDWECHVPDTAGSAEVANHDGVRKVAVEHADGQVVVLTSAHASELELVAAAADPRLSLPGDAPVSPPRLAAETFASAGVAALVVGDESFAQTSIDRTPEVRGSWSVAGAARGTLSWSARPVYSGAGWQCSKTYRSCTDLVVDELGRTVHVAQLKKKLGGGWVIEYDGPSYAVRVTTSDPKFPKKRAYAFVTHESWQPVR